MTRTLILSDTHMARPGRGAGSIEALRPLWAGVDHLVMNGDTAETRAQRHYDVSLQRIEELRQAAEADGVKLTMIAGNHDPFVVDRDWVWLAGGAVLATHGDLLHPAIAPWSEEAEELEQLQEEAVAEVADDPQHPDLDEQAEASKRASARHWRSHAQDRFAQRDRSWWARRWRQARKAACVLYYWHVMPKRAMSFAENEFPGCRFFVFGHIHRPGVWIDQPRGDQPGRVILNTGSFHMPTRPRAVLIDDDRLTFWKIHLDKKRGHRLGQKPLRAFALDGHEIDL